MTEKAQKLYNKFHIEQDLPARISKICAIICVEEMLNIIPMYVGNLNPAWKEWDEIRKELKLL